MSITFTEGKSFSEVVLRDYFPLYVLFAEKEPDLLRHFDIVKDPTDCIEFACDYTNNRLLRINLVLANSYSIVQGPLAVEACPLGSFAFDLPPITNTEVFQSKIYDNGIEIALSREEPFTFYGAGDIRIGLNASGEIVRICSLNMSADAIAHAKEELGAGADAE